MSYGKLFVLQLSSLSPSVNALCYSGHTSHRVLVE